MLIISARPDDNHAYALVDLSYRAEAVGLWEKLVSDADQAVADAAEQILELHHKLILTPLYNKLHHIAIQHNWGLHHLEDPTPQSLHSFINSVLREAIESRDSGHPELSLALLDATLASGIYCPWLDDNRARALVDLGRRGEAVELWEKLETNTERSVVDAAQQMLKLHRKLIFTSLHNKLYQLATKHNWPLNHLQDPSPQTLHSFTNSILREAIDARDSGHPSLSLSLLDTTLACGIKGPWLDDNRARALMDLGRCEEAVEIWRKLCTHPNKDIRHSAEKMMQYFGDQTLHQITSKDTTYKKAHHIQTIEQSSAQESALLSALRCIFPYKLYRELRPELKHSSDHDLLRYFISNIDAEKAKTKMTTCESEAQKLRSKLDTYYSKQLALVESINQTDEYIEVLRHDLANLFDKS